MAQFARRMFEFDIVIRFNLGDVMSESVIELLSGFSAATFAASALFFLRFWYASRDRFFALFSAALWCLSIERVALTLVRTIKATSANAIIESNEWVYIFRLLAFALITWAIVDKNRRTGVKSFPFSK